MSDEEWAVVVPCVTLLPLDAGPRDYERLPETVAGVHVIAFACLMRHRAAPLFAGLGS